MRVGRVGLVVRNCSRHIVGMIIVLVVLLVVSPISQASSSRVFTEKDVMASGALVLLTLQADRPLAEMLQGPPGGAQGVAEAASGLAGPPGLIAIHSLLYSQDQKLAERSAGAVATSLGITYVLKSLCGRQRPDAPDSDGDFTGISFDDSRQSMPSGHTAAAFAMAGVLADHDPEHASAYLVAATLVGLSRVYLHRHWPSDVVAGALVGLGASRCF